MSNRDNLARLADPACLAFPFRVGAAGPQTSRASAHARAQIEQVLFTAPGERVFRPDFGAGLEALVFEPNNRPLWEVTRRRILASLAQALRGAISPESLDITVAGAGERLEVVVTYRLASLGSVEEQRFFVGVNDRG